MASVDSLDFNFYECGGCTDAEKALRMSIESEGRDLRRMILAPEGLCEYMGDRLPYFLILAPLYLVLVFGGQRIMKNRERFHLRRRMIMWNACLSLFSILGMSFSIPALATILYRGGLWYAVCSPAPTKYGEGFVGIATISFIYSKIPELVDTGFIVLRKSPLIFLHWFHHATVLAYCIHSFSYQSANGLFFIAMNYTVHAVMYYYYFLRACGEKPKWALMVTTLQIGQMVLGMCVTVATWYFWNDGRACHVNQDNFRYSVLMYSSYLALFLKFAVGRYLYPSPKKTRGGKKKEIKKN